MGKTKAPKAPLPEVKRLASAAKSWLSSQKGLTQTAFAEQNGLDPGHLSHFLNYEGEWCGLPILRALGPHLPQEVADVVRLTLPASARPLWPNLARLLARMRLTDEEEAFLRGLNHVWPRDRPTIEWHQDLEKAFGDDTPRARAKRA